MHQVEGIHIELGHRKVLLLFTFSFWNFETGSDYVAVGFEFFILLLES